MNKVEKVSIGGYAFAVDAEAYKILEQYLAELDEHYGANEDGKEILEGIEGRLAELLFEKCGADGIVGVNHVNDVISVLGRPDDIDGETSENTTEAKKKFTLKGRKLYRDSIDKKLGGVCSGLGYFFGIDALFFRIGFLALTLVMIFAEVDGWVCTLPLIYMVLWICMPEAVSVQQRCEMMGEDGTVETIRRKVAAETSRTSAKQSASSPIIARLMGVIVGTLLLIIGVSGLMTGVALTMGQTIFGADVMSSFNFMLDGEASQLLNIFLELWDNVFFKVLAALTFFLPFLGMTWGGLQMCFDFKSPSWKPGLTIFVLWVAALVLFAVLLIVKMAATPAVMNTLLF